MMEEERTFLDLHKDSMEALGFWTEQYRSTAIIAMESMYKTDVIREWHISDLVPNGEKLLIKWHKRYTPLTDEQLKEKYGRV
jgi:hypothetical protein